MSHKRPGSSSGVRDALILTEKKEPDLDRLLLLLIFRV
jgi:hypothetical protein